MRSYLVAAFSNAILNLLAMKKQLTFVYGILLILTILTAFLSQFSVDKIVVLAILIFSVLKFLLVAFYFMELKKANAFWKVTLSLFTAFLIGVITLII